MYIRLYSKDSRPRLVTCCKVDAQKVCTEVKNFKCVKRTSFFGFKYEKDKESTIDETDSGWYLNVWLDGSVASEQLKIGRSYWVQESLATEPIEYKVETRKDLEELRSFLMKAIS
ncbi:MAG: hypothetical protein MJZ34_07300 [Paludibacteraceae bacterium]|nr:hypothetical protein [Paludibacteraceae bacterium]